MIVDFHCHIWDKELMSEGLRALLVDFAKQARFDENLIMDGTAERLIPEMDDAGIDKSVILGLDYEFLFKGKVSYKDYNNLISEYLKEYPDRLIGFAGIDPRRGKGAIQELERCVGELGF